VPDVLRVDVQPRSIQVIPGGAPQTLKLRVFNGTRVIDEFKISAIGTGQWLQAGSATLRLFPDKEDEAEIAVSIPAGQFVPAGPRTIGVRVDSTSNPNLSTTEQVDVDVAAVTAEVTMTVEPQLIRGGKTAEMNATIVNKGNVPFTVTFAGQDAENAARFGFRPQSVEVPAGGQASTRVTASAPRAFFGTETQRQLTISAQGAPVPLIATATFLQAPRYTQGWLRALRTFLSVLAAGVMIVGAFMVWTHAPELRKGVDLDYRAYGRMAFNANLQTPSTSLSDDVLTFVTSAGFVAIFLGVIALLGAMTSTGKLTRVAGAIALFLVLAAFVVLYVSPGSQGTPSIGPGAIAVVVGAIVAIVGGSFAKG
jgi:hypothetical protein